MQLKILEISNEWQSPKPSIVKETTWKPPKFEPIVIPQIQNVLLKIILELLKIILELLKVLKKNFNSKLNIIKKKSAQQPALRKHFLFNYILNFEVKTKPNQKLEKIYMMCIIMGWSINLGGDRWRKARNLQDGLPAPELNGRVGG